MQVQVPLTKRNMEELMFRQKCHLFLGNKSCSIISAGLCGITGSNESDFFQCNKCWAGAQPDRILILPRLLSGIWDHLRRLFWFVVFRLGNHI